MPIYAVVGGQWGDEGKGKVIDCISGNADIVVRFSGGNNAGHTVINKDKEYKFHSLPSGMCREGVTNIIGNSAVVNPSALLEEISYAQQAKLPGKVIVSDRAHLVMPYHLVLDKAEEKMRRYNAIGTTGKGIGPAYADKVSRLGIRAGELLNVENLINRLPEILKLKNSIISKLYGEQPIVESDVTEQVLYWAHSLKQFIKDTHPIIQNSIQQDQTVILEGAQGTMLDIDIGTYPFVTSSNPTIGGCFVSMGMGIKYLDSLAVAGVFKAFCTRVGAGEFPTELDEQESRILREHANEYGVTTGRPRRVGWFDSVAAKYAVTVNGMESAILTRLDTLDNRKFVPICTAYRVNGKITRQFPSDPYTLSECKPVYEIIEGWNTTTRGTTRWEDVPMNAKKYIYKLEELLGINFSIISTGPRRDEVIVRRDVHSAFNNLI